MHLWLARTLFLRLSTLSYFVNVLEMTQTAKLKTRNLSKTWLRRLPGAATRAAPGPLDRLQGQGDLEMVFRFKGDG